MSMIELITRTLANQRLRHEEADRHRQEARRAEEKAQAEAFIAAEAERAAHRLELARQLLAEAEAFGQTREAQWAHRVYGSAQITQLLHLDRDHRLIHGGVLGLFHRIPYKKVDSPEKLATSMTTPQIITALFTIRTRRFWLWALRLELRLLRQGFLPW